MKIYVGNLSYEVTDEDLQEAFGAFGDVASAEIVTDRFSGRSKGFGFVEMPSEEEAQSAIVELNGKELKGRTLRVDKARPRSGDRRGGGSGTRGWRSY